MHRLVAVCLALSAACGGGGGNSAVGETGHAAVRPPVEDLIFGTYERHPPTGTTAIKLQRDGTLVLAKDKDHLDDDKPLANGSWQLTKGVLTLSYSMGECADSHTGTYKVGVTKLGIHFTKVEDACETRSHLDGETWFRIRAKNAEE